MVLWPLDGVSSIPVCDDFIFILARIGNSSYFLCVLGIINPLIVISPNLKFEIVV